eukprot:351612-Chlamydomonas_euryale.AAC.24
MVLPAGMAALQGSWAEAAGKTRHISAAWRGVECMQTQVAGRWNVLMRPLHACIAAHCAVQGNCAPKGVHSERPAD